MKQLFSEFHFVSLAEKHFVVSGHTVVLVQGKLPCARVVRFFGRTLAIVAFGMSLETLSLSSIYPAVLHLGCCKLVLVVEATCASLVVRPVDWLRTKIQ